MCTASADDLAAAGRVVPAASPAAFPPAARGGKDRRVGPRSTAYTVRVQARDGAGNVSPPSRATVGRTTR